MTGRTASNKLAIAAWPLQHGQHRENCGSGKERSETEVQDSNTGKPYRLFVHIHEGIVQTVNALSLVPVSTGYLGSTGYCCPIAYVLVGIPEEEGMSLFGERKPGTMRF